MSEDDVSENVKKGSDNIVEGLSRLRDGLTQYYHSLSTSLENHPIIKFIVFAPVSAGIASLGLQAVNWISVYFFGATGIVSRDLRVQTFPAPIGFTLWVLLTLFVLFVILVYLRLVTLRQRIDSLEEQVQNK